MDSQHPRFQEGLNELRQFQRVCPLDAAAGEVPRSREVQRSIATCMAPAEAKEYKRLLDRHSAVQRRLDDVQDKLRVFSHPSSTIMEGSADMLAQCGIGSTELLQRSDLTLRHLSSLRSHADALRSAWQVFAERLSAERITSLADIDDLLHDLD